MLDEKFVSVVISAAGSGRRMGKDGKLHLAIAGQSVLKRTLCRFARIDWIDELVLVIRSQEEEAIREVVKELDFSCAVKFVTGGKERHDSVERGLSILDEKSDLVLIHDGARPFVTVEDVLKVAECAIEKGACALAIPVTDTVKIVREDLSVVATPDRSKLYRVQTPQGFHTELLKYAYQSAREEGINGTDDCSIVEKLGKPVQLVRGRDTNIKITTRADLFIGEGIAREEERCE